MPVTRLPRSPVEVHLGGKLNPDARMISASVGSGSAGLPHAEFVIEPKGRSGSRKALENLDLIDFAQDECKVLIPGRSGLSIQAAHFGIVSAVHYTLSESGDSIRYISRLEPHHFGQPLKECRFWNTTLNDAVEVDLPTVFNPEVDDVITGNLSEKRGKLNCGLFIHADAAQTEAARKFNKSPDPKKWTLPEAVYYLCCTLNTQTAKNPATPLVKNPTLTDLQKVLPADEDLLRNFECSFGDYLPELLDAILEPFGFTWTVDLFQAVNRIRVYNRNESPVAAQLDLQKVGEKADLNKSNIHALSLTADVSSGAFNSINAVGEHVRYESTFELVPGWKKEDDDAWEQDADTGVSNLSKNAPEWTTLGKLADVWRRWVLNEGGDYIGYRTGLNKPYDFNQLFGPTWIPRRRKFLPCLSRQENGEPWGHVVGVFIEWSDDAGETWYKLDQLESIGRACRVLEAECGIYFNGDEVPDELRLAGTAEDGGLKAKIRVTACVEGDERKTVKDQNISVLQKNKLQLLNVPSQLKFRKRDDSSIFTAYHSERFPLNKIEADDKQAIQKSVGILLDRFNVASVQGTIRLPAFGYDKIKIGQEARGIPGRNVNFKIHSNNFNHPTIVGMQFNFDDQTTDLVIGNYRGALRI